MKFEIEKSMLERVVSRLMLQESVIDYLTSRQPVNQLISEINQAIKPIEETKEEKETKE